PSQVGASSHKRGQPHAVAAFRLSLTREVTSFTGRVRSGQVRCPLGADRGLAFRGPGNVACLPAPRRHSVAFKMEAALVAATEAVVLFRHPKANGLPPTPLTSATLPTSQTEAM